jgi:hypothetical protein
MKFWQGLALALIAGPGAAGVDAPPPENASHYTLFIHSGGGSLKEDAKLMAVMKVVSALAQRGYLVRPWDNYADNTVVDYFAESDKDIAQDVADVVNDVLYKSEPTVKPRYQPIRNPTGYIGVWLFNKN